MQHAIAAPILLTGRACMARIVAEAIARPWKPWYGRDHIGGDSTEPLDRGKPCLHERAVARTRGARIERREEEHAHPGGSGHRLPAQSDVAPAQAFAPGHAHEIHDDMVVAQQRPQQIDGGPVSQAEDERVGR
jgi:hypothetical protein